MVYEFMLKDGLLCNFVLSDMAKSRKRKNTIGVEITFSWSIDIEQKYDTITNEVVIPYEKYPMKYTL